MAVLLAPGQFGHVDGHQGAGAAGQWRASCRVDGDGQTTIGLFHQPDPAITVQVLCSLQAGLLQGSQGAEVVVQALANPAAGFAATPAAQPVPEGAAVEAFCRQREAAALAAGNGKLQVLPGQVAALQALIQCLLAGLQVRHAAGDRFGGQVGLQGAGGIGENVGVHAVIRRRGGGAAYNGCLVLPV